MSYPRKVRVLNMVFTLGTPATPEEENALGDDFGKTRHALQRVLLSRGQVAATMQDTVLHELLHACLFQTSLASDSEWSKQEETVVRGLTPILLRVLQDNPKLVAYLLERL